MRAIDADILEVKYNLAFSLLRKKTIEFTKIINDILSRKNACQRSLIQGGSKPLRPPVLS